MENLHNSIADYANTGMRPQLAQALTLEGIVRFLMMRQQERAFNEFRADTDEVRMPPTPVRISVSWQVYHFCPWLKEAANEAARAAGDCELSLIYLTMCMQGKRPHTLTSSLSQRITESGSCTSTSNNRCLCAGDIDDTLLRR